MEYETFVTDHTIAISSDKPSSISSITTATTALSDYFCIKADCMSLHENQHENQEVPDETKSILKHDGKRIEVTNFEDGVRTNTKYIMPDIKDITVHNDRVVIVEFVDGSVEKAVLSAEDKFSLEQGVAICLTKKLVGGSSIYNKLVDYALLKYERIQKQKEKEAAKLKEERERKRRIAKKKAAKKAAKRDEYVQTLKEAFSKALAESNNG